MSESVLVNCLLKAIALLVLVTNRCVFESLLCSVCVRVLCAAQRKGEK